METRSNHRVRFKSFELDLSSRELRKNGLKLKLQGQPVEVLTMLLERPGEVVTREDIQRRLWPEDTFVDFEHSLNSTVRRLRDALGDSADNPRFIETLPRLGYRFIASVDQNLNGLVHPTSNVNGNGSFVARSAAIEPLIVEPVSQTEPATRDSRSPLKGWRWQLAGAAGAIAVLAIMSIRYMRRPLPPLRITEVVQLTHDVRFHRKLVLGTDGVRVYLSLEPPGLGFVPVSGGEISTIPFTVPGAQPVYAEWLDDVSPDGLSFLAGGAVKDGVWECWVVGTSGAPVRYLTECHDMRWSPDGKQVVYTNARGDILRMPSSGGPSRLLLPWNGEPGNFAKCLIWSPDGNRIRFVRDARIWEISSEGGNLHEILPATNGSVLKYCGRWTPDGAFYIFLAAKSRRSGFQIWALDERHSGLRPPNPEPVELTSGPNPWSLPTISKDGRTLYAPNEIRQGELVRFDKRAGQFQPYLDGISAEWVDFSPNGKFVAYVLYPESTLWRANRDGSGRVQLATLPSEANARGLHWSPDGSRIAFAESVAGVDAIYQVPAEGGTPVRVLPGVKESQSGPTWSPDGSRLAYWVNTTDETSMAAIRIADLATHTITHLPPAPKSVEWPLWSPDGRYILCRLDWLEAADFGFALFDTQTQKWSILHQPAAPSHPNWSHDSHFVYFLRTQVAEPGMYRMSIPDGRTELTVSLKDFRTTGSMRKAWLGLDPDDAPLLLRDAGSMEVYALALDRK